MDHLHTYQPLLFSIAYRMTGYASQAEDIVQDAYLRYQQADQAAIRSPKSYLTTIVTNLSLNYLHSARAQREEYIGIWLPGAYPPLLSPKVNLPKTIMSSKNSFLSPFSCSWRP